MIKSVAEPLAACDARGTAPAAGGRARRSSARPCWCSTALCRTWCSSIGEMPCSTLVSQTADARRPADHHLIDVRDEVVRPASTSRAARRRSSEVPRRQHHIRNAMAPPTVSGNQPPSTIFSELAARNAQSTVPNTAITGTAASQRPVPAPRDHEVQQHGGRQHGAGHRDAVGRAEIVRRFEHHHDQQRAGHQQPVGGRHVDLAGLVARGRHDVDARAKAPSASPAGSARTRRRSAPATRSPSRRRRARSAAAAPSPAPACRTGCRPPAGWPASARPGRNSSAPAPAAPGRTRPAGSPGAPTWPMSAYSASPPVSARKMAPNTAAAMAGMPVRTGTAASGLSAVEDAGRGGDVDRAEHPDRSGTTPP